MLLACSCSSFCTMLLLVTVHHSTISRNVNDFPHCTVTFYKIGVCHLLQVFQGYLLQSFEICKQISPVPCLAVSSGQIHGKAQVGVEAPDQACSCIGDRPVEFHLLNIPLFYLFYLLKNCLLKVINIHSLVR